MKKRPMMVAGVSVVLLAALAWMLQGPEKSETRNPRITKASSKSASSTSETTDSPTRRERRASAPASRLDSSLTRHDASKLVNFILPQVDGKNVSIHRALAILKEAYQDACYRSREKALDLKFSVKDDPGYTISFSLKGKSFTACLDYLAALAGLEATRDEARFELAAIDDTGKQPELLGSELQRIKERLSKICGMPPADGNMDVESLLRTAGLIRDPNASFKAGPNDSWSFKGPASDRLRILHACGLASELPNQLKLATCLIDTDAPADLKACNLGPAEREALMRELAQRKGTNLMTEPSVTARDGQIATMEIINDKIVNGQADWTGIKHEVSGSYVGLKLVGSDKSECRQADPDDSGWLSENEFALYPGDTHIQLVSSGNGKYRYRLLTVTPIDATGRPLTNDQTPEGEVVNAESDSQEVKVPIRSEVSVVNGIPTASRVPGNANIVFSPYNNKIIDVQGMPSGALVSDPTFPSEERKIFRVP